MKQKTFFLSAGIVFLAAGTLHLIRSIYGLDLVLGTWDVQMWISWTVVLIAGTLSYNSFKFWKKK